MNKYQDTLIQNIKYYRNQNNLSQEKLAEKCECATPTIGSIECGRQLPSFDLLIKISEALSISPADLFIRDCSLTQNHELYAKYNSMIQNFEMIPEYEKESLRQFIKNLAENNPSNKSSN